MILSKFSVCQDPKKSCPSGQDNQRAGKRIKVEEHAILGHQFSRKSVLWRRSMVLEKHLKTTTSSEKIMTSSFSFKHKQVKNNHMIGGNSPPEEERWNPTRMIISNNQI
nr:hypothetical protein CFP56_68579 [Quercus suber]